MGDGEHRRSQQGCEVFSRIYREALRRAQAAHDTGKIPGTSGERQKKIPGVGHTLCGSRHMQGETSKKKASFTKQSHQSPPDARAPWLRVVGPVEIPRRR